MGGSIKRGVSCCARAFIRRADMVFEGHEAHKNKLYRLAKQRDHSISDLGFVSRRNCLFTVSCKTQTMTYRDVKYSN